MTEPMKEPVEGLMTKSIEGPMTRLMKGAIFDCDGTLIDSAKAWRAVETELFKAVGGRVTDEVARALSPLTIPEAAVYLHDTHGVGADADDVVRMIGEGMLAFYRSKAQPRPGALEFVQALHARGIRCSVASSSPQDFLQAGLACAGFLPYLDAVVSVEDVGASKREPAVFDRACELMGTSPADTWGFEDSIYAIHTLKAAGYRTVGIYERDTSGTFEQLKETADIAVLSFEDLDPSMFL